MKSTSSSRRRFSRLVAQIIRPSLSEASLESWRSKSPVEDPTAWAAYRDAAVKRAMELGNRGPARFDEHGNLAKEIQDAYWRCGFYVFEGLVDFGEVAEIQAEFQERLENAPITKGSKVDKQGRPVKFPQAYDWLAPHTAGNTTEAWKSGTDMGSTTATPQGGESEGPQMVVGNIMSPIRTMQSALRMYAHPKMLKISETFHGADFTPMYQSVFHKEPGVGQATSWHQDGRTHWDPEGKPGRREGLPPRQPGAEYPEDLGCHGGSFHVALSKCIPEQCMWVIPGTHKELFWQHWANHKFETRDKETGKVNYLVKSAFTSGEIEWWPDAVPMLMQPGDVGIHNRSCVHGSFPNSSPERRVTLVCAYYNRRYVINQQARFKMGKKEAEKMVDKGKTVVNQRMVMDENHIKDKTRIIQLAIDARKERFPDETPYVYQPHFGEAMPDRDAYIKDYVSSFGLDV